MIGRGVGKAIMLLAAVAMASAPAAFGHHDEPVAGYAHETGSLVVGAQGALGVDGLDSDGFNFTALGSHPDLRLVLDFSPTEANAHAGPANASVLYALRVDLTNTSSGLVEASYVYAAPGTRSHMLTLEMNATQEYQVALVLLWGVDVTWDLRVDGWRAPEPLFALSKP